MRAISRSRGERATPSARGSSPARLRDRTQRTPSTTRSRMTAAWPSSSSTGAPRRPLSSIKWRTRDRISSEKDCQPRSSPSQPSSRTASTGMLGRVASSALGEGELEMELEGETEGELEYEGEAEAAPTQTQALAELMAAVASQARTEAEAEALAGAATVNAISPADRAALRVVLPHLVRGTAILTRILRQRRITRPAVRAVPTIARRTASVLARRAAAGPPVTRG